MPRGSSPAFTPRAIVGWSAASHKRAKLVLDALQMALWRRDRAGHPAGPGLIHHSDAGSQYTSFRFTAHLIEATGPAYPAPLPVPARLLRSCSQEVRFFRWVPSSAATPAGVWSL